MGILPVPVFIRLQSQHCECWFFFLGDFHIFFQVKTDPLMDKGQQHDFKQWTKLKLQEPLYRYSSHLQSFVHKWLMSPKLSSIISSPDTVVLDQQTISGLIVDPVISAGNSICILKIFSISSHWLFAGMSV